MLEMTIPIRAWTRMHSLAKLAEQTCSLKEQSVKDADEAAAYVRAIAAKASAKAKRVAQDTQANGGRLAANWLAISIHGMYACCLQVFLACMRMEKRSI